MATTPKYDNDYVTLGYLNKTLSAESEETKTEINKIPKNYNSPPVPPYYENSLLLLNGQIYKCIKSRLVGSFNISDWKIVVSTNELDEALRFIYDVNKLEYVDQEDGVIETFYQEEDPSLNWETDIEKNKHVSDLWTIDNSICYQYEKKATNPVTYGWKRVNIPTSLFDIVDGYRKIFTEEPTNYSKDDLWLGEITKIAIESSETFDSSHWEDRDDFIESSITEQEEYHKVYLLPKITEINRQTQSEIRKAVDEIVLRVSQTYTTKTEVEQYIDDVKTGVAEEYTTKEEFNAQLSLTSTQINAIVEKNTQQDGNIETLNQEYSNLKITSDGIKTQVSSIESEIESTNENVNSLQTEIQGVNANFNEFKDNEYINSINNLQDQIDGAIQFWNGPEIPTIENYPANEWITENEKINHQADIYTVIQDVEGEMKQGKSYRFDKINGVWQWIELTDNELSAVQAIAQDALNKSNQNTTDIQSLNKKTSELEQTDSEIKASVTTLNNKYEKDITLTKQVSGNPITIEDAGAYPCENFIVEGKSEQKVTTPKAGDNIFDFQQWHKKISAGDMTISYGRGSGLILNDNGFSTRNVPTATDSWISINAKVDGELVGWSYTSTGISDAKKQVAKQFTLPAKASTEYTLSCDVSFDTTLTGTAMKTELYAFLYDENFDYLGLKTLQIKNEFEANVPQRLSLKFSTNATTKYIFWRVDNESYNTAPANMTVSNISIKEGTDTTYTEYVPNSPSPDYPSEIETVKGIENLCDGINQSYYLNTACTSAGKTTGNSGLAIPINGVKKITISTNIIQSRFRVGCVNELPTSTVGITVYNGVNKDGLIRNITIDTTGYNYLIINATDLTEIQIEKGTTSHPFVPYGSRYLINKITGKNLFDKDNVISGYFNSSGSIVNSGSWYYQYIKVQPNENYIISGVATNNSTPQVVEFDKDMNFVRRVMSYRVGNFITNENTAYVGVSVLNTDLDTYQLKDGINVTEYEPYKENIITYDLKKENKFDKDSGFEKGYLDATGNKVANNNVALFDYIPIKANTKYTMSLKERLEYRFAYYDNNKMFISRTDAFFGSSSFKTPENIKYLKVFINVSQTVTQEIIDGLDIKIYEGTGTDDYYELASINDIKDKLDEVSGELTKRIGKMVLDGTQNITTLSDGNNGEKRFRVEDPTIKNIPNNVIGCICDKYKGVTYNDTRAVLNSISVWSEQNIFCITTDSKTKTLAEFKEELADNPAIVCYELAKPETIQLGQTNIELFEGVNSIYTLDDLEPNMNITYLTDSKLNSQYATKSELKVAENSIKASVSGEITELDKKTEASLELKVDRNDNDQIVSMINASAEEINLKANRFSMESDKSKIDKDGTVKFEGGTIGGFDLSTTNFSSEISGIYDYTGYDIRNAIGLVMDFIHNSSIQRDILDIDDEPGISALDVIKIQKIILGHEPSTKVIDAEFKINSQDPKNCVSLICNGETAVSLGAGGINADVTNTKSLIVSSPADDNSSIYGIYANGETAQLRITNNENTTLISPTVISTGTIYADNIKTGRCVLNSTNITTVEFDGLFTYEAPPTVIITPSTSTTGVIAPKTTEVTTTGFKATIGGSGIPNVVCHWIAIG